MWYNIEKVNFNESYKERMTEELGYNFDIYKIESVIYATDEDKPYHYTSYALINLSNYEIDYISDYEIGD
jgi:acid phosphatase class B